MGYYSNLQIELIEEMQTKRCKHCKKSKPLNAYLKSRYRRGYYRQYCRECEDLILEVRESFIEYCNRTNIEEDALART